MSHNMFEIKPQHTIHIGTAAAYIAIVAFMIYCAVQLISLW